MSQSSPVSERDEALVRDLALAFAAGKYEGGETLFEMYANIALKFMETRGLAQKWQQWQPIDAMPARSDAATLLYFPPTVVGAYKQNTLPAMYRTGHPDEYPNRKPSHFMLLGAPSDTSTVRPNISNGAHDSADMTGKTFCPHEFSYWGQRDGFRTRICYACEATVEVDRAYPVSSPVGKTP